MASLKGKFVNLFHIFKNNFYRAVFEIISFLCAPKWFFFRAQLRPFLLFLEN